MADAPSLSHSTESLACFFTKEDDWWLWKIYTKDFLHYSLLIQKYSIPLGSVSWSRHSVKKKKKKNPFKCDFVLFVRLDFKLLQHDELLLLDINGGRNTYSLNFIFL